MTNEIHFYAPGLKKFQTREYATQDVTRFTSISVTGTECALACDHCGMQVLRGMTPLPARRRAVGDSMGDGRGGALPPRRRATGSGLYELCAELYARGTRGILVSGGCDSQGRVPLLPHIGDLQRVRQELGMTIRVHTGVVDAPTAQALGQVELDGAMIDVIGAEETIRRVYHLDRTVADYEAALAYLEENGVPTIPHIILGLHYGRMLGEYTALEMVARHPPKLLVLIVLMPLYGTVMMNVTPPPLEEIGEFFAHARARLPETPIMLGCARPLGPRKAEIDRLAIDAGLNGIAYPAEGIVGYARARGLTPRFHDACCGVHW